MKVQLRDLPVHRAIELSNVFVREAVAGMPNRVILDSPADDPEAGEASAELDLHNDDDGNVYVRGRISGWFSLGCSRCIEPVRQVFREDLDATYRPAGTIPGGELEEDAGNGASGTGASGDRAGSRGGARGGGASDDDLGLELSDEELDLYSYEGESIDLEPLLREQLILAVPFAPLCREECKGLCPQCGIDRNQERCTCTPPIDPRLAALRDIKL